MKSPATEDMEIEITDTVLHLKDWEKIPNTVIKFSEDVGNRKSHILPGAI